MVTKVQFQKFMWLAPTLTSFHYIMNPGMLENQVYSKSIYKTLEYSKDQQYLDTCQTNCKIFMKKFQPTIIFAGRYFLDHFRYLLGF